MESLNKKCRCALCGEIITSPYFFDNKIYGWSCIKRVNPLAKKTKYFASADFTIEKNIEYNYIVVKFNGKKYGFTQILKDNIIIRSSGIYIIDNVAYFNSKLIKNK